LKGKERIGKENQGMADRKSVGPGQEGYDHMLHDASLAEEDIQEGMSRMIDEGGGVVEQTDPQGAPILRNSLIDVDGDSDTI
jgi:hypothetical protein